MKIFTTSVSEFSEVKNSTGNSFKIPSAACIRFVSLCIYVFIRCECPISV